MAVVDILPAVTLRGEWHRKTTLSINRVFIDMMSHDTGVLKRQFKSKEASDNMFILFCMISF